MEQRAELPHDCRITLRCLKGTFGFTLALDRGFASLRSENTLIDKLFEMRQHDERGGEGGERVRQIESRPCFKLTSGRMRGATWFDRDHPPQGIVWLLGAEMHDERHKGRSDAYDILGKLDAAGELFPVRLDHKLLELDRRRWDTSSFGTDLRSDATTLARVAVESGHTETTLAGVPVRAIVKWEDSSMVGVYVAVSVRPIKGPRSGLPFPLTEERFLLLQEGVRAAVEAQLGNATFAGEIGSTLEFPGGRRGDERAFVVLGEASSRSD